MNEQQQMIYDAIGHHSPMAKDARIAFVNMCEQVKELEESYNINAMREIIKQEHELQVKVVQEWEDHVDESIETCKHLVAGIKSIGDNDLRDRLLIKLIRILTKQAISAELAAGYVDSLINGENK